MYKISTLWTDSGTYAYKVGNDKIFYLIYPNTFRCSNKSYAEVKYNKTIKAPVRVLSASGFFIIKIEDNGIGVYEKQLLDVNLFGYEANFIELLEVTFEPFLYTLFEDAVRVKTERPYMAETYRGVNEFSKLLLNN